MGGAIFYRGTRVSQSKRRKSHGERGYGRPDHREFFCPRRIKGSLIISKYDLHFYLDQYERDYPDEVLQKIDPLKLLSKEKWERIQMEPWG